MNKGLVVVAVVAVIIILVLCVLLTRSNAAREISESLNRVLRSENALQATVISTQAFNFNQFNQVAENANRLNSLIDAGTEKNVIKYREILRREKTCDFPIPNSIANGLFQYTHRLRSIALHTDTSRTDQADDRASTTNPITYCQAVLWIEPLLAVIENGNNQLSGIRTVEQIRSNNKG